jgi:hypothetical protein
MKRFRAVLTLATCFVAACVLTVAAGKYGEKTLVGTWEFDVVKMMKQAMQGQETPPGMDIEKMAADMYMRVTFVKDGTYSVDSKVMGSVQQEAGKWEVLETDGDTVKVKSVADDGEEQILTITFADNDHFDALTVDGEQSVTMSATRSKDDGKKKPEKKAETKSE